MGLHVKLGISMNVDVLFYTGHYKLNCWVGSIPFMALIVGFGSAYYVDGLGKTRRK